MAASTLSPSITTLINKSISNGCFLPKRSWQNNSQYIRVEKQLIPISILPTISKVFEKYANQHLIAYLIKHKLIHETQSGFRQKHSCQTALVKLADQWLSCIDKGDIVGTFFVHFRKAFDLVNHSILIHKLTLYKFSPLSLRWFQSYLSSRIQAIANDVGLSKFVNVSSGVPQGSILDTSLFLLFINDLPFFLNHCFADFFADDATFHTYSNSVDVIKHHLQKQSTGVSGINCQ